MSTPVPKDQNGYTKQIPPHKEDHVIIESGDGSTSSTLSQIEVRMDTTETSKVRSLFGLLISCLGCAVGTGNIWRFPRILATQSYYKGSLTFYIAWALLLFLWSSPVLLVEYAVGRFTKNSPLVAYRKFFGNYFVWIGGWIVTTAFFISAYYSVIIGWCFYYLFVSCTFKELPSTEEEGLAIFENFVMQPQWTVLCQLLAIVLTGVFLFGGVRWIGRANTVLVPLLLLILTFTFGWSLTRPYADAGIKFLFTPTWASFANPGLWIAAASQNAFDTGAGWAAILTFATYMGRSSSITKYSVSIPLMNNLVSLYSSITIFSTVFSTLIVEDGAMTRPAILEIMQESGPGSTGLTFTWIPVLFSKVGIAGRILCALFFLCLSFAGISSLLANIQIYILVIKEMGVPHRLAVAGSLIACVLVGLPSAIKLEMLENQDNTWGYALVVSGLFLALLVIVYRPFRFRRVLINEYGTDDWKVPIVWVFLITLVVPGIGLFLIAWWIYDFVVQTEQWYIFTWTSVISTLVEWLIVLVGVVVANLLAVYIKGDLYVNNQQIGANPYKPETYAKSGETGTDEVFTPNRSLETVVTD